jgi:hypothetical protein
VTSGGEEVAAQSRQPDVLDPEAVDAVDAEQDPLGLAAAAVERAERVGDPPAEA